MTYTDSFDILIRGCTALTSDPAQPVIDDAVIGIRGDRLAFIAKANERSRKASVSLTPAVMWRPRAS